MNLTVRQKLILGFGAICLLTVALAVYQLSRFSDAMRLMSAVVSNDVHLSEMINSITEIESGLRSTRENALNLVVVAQAQGRSADVGVLRERYAEGGRRLTSTLEQIRDFTAERANIGVTEQRRQEWSEANRIVIDLERTGRALVQETLATFDLLQRGQVGDTAARRDRLDDLRRTLDQNLTDMNSRTRALTDAGRHELERIYDATTRDAAIVLTVVVGIAVAVAYVIGRSITQRLATAIGFIGRIGQGDLTSTISVPGNDELSELGRHLHEMTTRLRSVAETTRGTAESVHAATAQIRASTQQQAASVAEQLAAVEETTATLSEITESGAQINRRSQDVAHRAQTASTSSDAGLRAVSDTNEVMNAIREQAEAVAENIVLLSERTQAIGEIIVTVNDIAERSHLLALNAAIEAAAAGEHGRTFAVVAGEIKSLADQAKEATAQVRSNLLEIQHGINASVMLTEEAVKRVAAGKRQTEATETTIRTMADNIQESLIAFQQIVAGTNQQQIGLEQVIQALQNIREASTQTAAGTRQLEGAASNLSALGEGLVEAVRAYRI